MAGYLIKMDQNLNYHTRVTLPTLLGLVKAKMISNP